MTPGEFVSQLDAENQSPSMNPVPLPENANDGEAINFLIDRVCKVISESAQMGTEPLSTIATVLANLYQAKALQEMAITAVEIRDVLQEISQELFHLRNNEESRDVEAAAAESGFGLVPFEEASASE